MNSSAAAASLHVILGAGQIGPMVAARLVAAGHRARLVRRGAFGAEVPAGVATANADILDARALDAAVAGASTIYHCVNPQYTEWPAKLLPYTHAIIGAAERAGAHLVVLDNLYMYGRAPGGVMAEDTPVAPCSRKGALRAQAAEALIAARARGVAVTIGRASDFIGPGAVQVVMLGDRFWPRAFAGKSVEALGDPDQPHAYSFTADVADALVTLGTDPRAANQLWHLPTLPPVSSRAVIEQVARVMGRALTIRPFPTWLVRGLGLVSPILREVGEMLYQWEAPFIVDDSRFRATFGRAATPLEEQLAQTLAWARTHYAAPARAAA